MMKRRLVEEEEDKCRCCCSSSSTVTDCSENDDGIVKLENISCFKCKKYMSENVLKWKQGIIVFCSSTCLIEYVNAQLDVCIRLRRGNNGEFHLSVK